MDNLTFKHENKASHTSDDMAKMSVEVRRNSSSSPLWGTTLGKILIAIAVVLFIICIILLALLIVEKDKDKDSCETKGERSTYSEEAERIALDDFLKKVQTTYYEYNRGELAWQPDKTSDDLAADLKERHLPYNATPAYLKAKTDAAFSLLDEINGKKIDEDKLRPRELKAVEQVKHFLRTVFGNPYDENFYNGDWMLGPNHFCWQAICTIGYSINAYAYHVKPSNLEDLKRSLEKILLNRESILRYKKNMQLGVRTGMVRSQFSCQSGLDAFKGRFEKISSKNDPADVLDEWFVKLYRAPKFIEKISAADRETWINNNNKKNISKSIDESLIEGIGKPLVELLNYMAKDHIRHCLPRDFSSGLANLPVDFIYLDGNATANRTTKTLPITNAALNGSEIYRNILPYFTTSDITPERINEIGNERLNALYPEVLAIAKNITEESNETAAVENFRKHLLKQNQYYNSAPFPVNESNADAHKNCTDAASAQKNCPKRWAALQIWANTCRQVMGMLSPKIIPLFYHTGKKITVPNCPIEMLPNFNPSSGAQFFRASTSSCTRPAYFGIPFFLENFGPRFSEWSVTAHEAWPGHHTQVQGRKEYFTDKYGGLPKWIDDQTSYTFFSEGWGLYSENPVIGEDTDTYKDNPMQKFGMLKWQIWRALRLIVDTGLHYRGINRTTALGYFSKYAWDETDIARKEVTRYQGVPGQATAYMLGQQKLVELRNYAKKKLGKKFKMLDFHYQVLSQGSAPEAYLVKHVTKYVKCTLGELKGELCDLILKVPEKNSGSSNANVDQDGPPKPPEYHYF